MSIKPFFIGSFIAIGCFLLAVYGSFKEAKTFFTFSLLISYLAVIYVVYWLGKVSKNEIPAERQMRLFSTFFAAALIGIIYLIAGFLISFLSGLILKFTSL